MTDDICQCLLPVIHAVKAVGGDEAIQWAGEMQEADRVGCICDKELAALRADRERISICRIPGAVCLINMLNPRHPAQNIR